MNRIKETAVLAWGEYLGCCDEGRCDEVLAIVGGLAAALLLLGVVLTLINLASCGTGWLGGPMLIASRVAWARRTR